MAHTHSIEQREIPHVTPVVRWLVIAWLGIALLEITAVSGADLATWLGFQSSNLTHAWWTLATYSLVQGDVWLLVVSVFTLLVFGPRVERVWGTRAFLLYYLWCVAGGALAHALFVRSGILEGATAGLFGVMMAYAWLWPNERLFLFGVLPMRVWTLVLVLAGLMLALGVTDGGMSGWGYVAHLGGFGFAALYLKRPNPLSIDELRQHLSQAPDPTDEPPRAIPRSMPRSRRGDEVDEIVAQSKAAVARRPMRTAQTAAVPDSKRDALNRVLDKISEQGLDSLTSEDRTLLEEMSRRLRGRNLGQ